MMSENRESSESNEKEAAPAADKAVDLTVYEGMPPSTTTDNNATASKDFLTKLSSLDTADETTKTDKDSSASPSGGTWAETPTSDFESLTQFHQGNNNRNPTRRRRLAVIIIGGVSLVLVILLASLGANGHFQQVSNQPNATGSSVPGTGSGDKDNDEETVDDNEHDTEKPDAPPPAADDNTEEPQDSNPVVPATLSPLRPVTYAPGLLTVEENGLLLSHGLTSRLIAERRELVQYANGDFSDVSFHRRPDYGACFPVPPDATENQGGWVYVSNSELEGPPSGLGGVGALYFDKDGEVVDYKMLLQNTTKNCAGGRTPWGTFVSCEEVEAIGQIYQVDPFNRRPPERITMGKLGGRYEAFAYDDRDKSTPRFFVTEDLSEGPTVRWTPDEDSIDWDRPWEILTGNGTMEYLVLKPDDATENSATTTIGTFEWTRNLTVARANAKLYARGTEGIDCNGRFLYFVCKTDALFYILDLDLGTYVMHPANIGLFDGEPDQVKRMVNDTQDILYFSEEGSGAASGVHGRDSEGLYFTILEGPGWTGEETTGLAFSPNGLHMYVAFQDPGVLFDITRTDGYPFHGASLDVRYHNPPLDHMLRP